MPRGGKRFGAGRKPGSTAKKTREIAQAILDQPGLSPLEYMVAVLRDPTAAQNRRDTFAIAAAPYTHPKLGAIAMLDAASKLTSITAVNAISVPHGMFLSREQADKDYRFRHDIEGAIVTPLWAAAGAGRDRKAITIEATPIESDAPRDPDGTPAEPAEVAPTIEGEVVVPLRAAGDK